MTDSTAGNVLPGTICNGQFYAARKLGAGNFGDFYLAYETQTGKTVGVKREKKTKCPQLHHEKRYYEILQNEDGFPRIFGFDQDSEGRSYLVMDLLGPSLEDLFDICERKFTPKTVALIGLQMVTRLETLHKKNLIYRDIKPENALIGIEDNTKVYMVDMGLAKFFTDSTGKHIPMKTGKSLTGTARYMSVNTHRGVEQSRRDDLESLAHMLIYFLKGQLPWQGLKCDPAERHIRIKELKEQTSVASLCSGLAEPFQQFMAYTRSLQFEEEPNYEACKGYFLNVLSLLRTSPDNNFDWMLRHRNTKVMDKINKYFQSEIGSNSSKPKTTDLSMLPGGRTNVSAGTGVYACGQPKSGRENDSSTSDCCICCSCFSKIKAYSRRKKVLQGYDPVGPFGAQAEIPMEVWAMAGIRDGFGTGGIGAVSKPENR